MANNAISLATGTAVYEQYRDEDVFKAHQQTEHFKAEVLGRAVPLLVRRERIPVELQKCGS